MTTPVVNEQQLNDLVGSNGLERGDELYSPWGTGALFFSLSRVHTRAGARIWRPRRRRVGLSLVPLPFAVLASACLLGVRVASARLPVRARLRLW